MPIGAVFTAIVRTVSWPVSIRWLDINEASVDDEQNIMFDFHKMQKTRESSLPDPITKYLLDDFEKLNRLEIPKEYRYYLEKFSSCIVDRRSRSFTFDLSKKNLGKYSCKIPVDEVHVNSNQRYIDEKGWIEESSDDDDYSDWETKNAMIQIAWDTFMVVKGNHYGTIWDRVEHADDFGENPPSDYRITHESFLDYVREVSKREQQRIEHERRLAVLEAKHGAYGYIWTPYGSLEKTKRTYSDYMYLEKQNP